MNEYVLFASVWFVAAATPGADTMLVLSAAISRGWKAVVPYSIGITLAKLVLLIGAYFGLTWLLAEQPQVLVALKWFGALFLVWRALSLWRTASAPESKALGGFWPGLAFAFAIGVSNPQAMLFYVALIPQVAGATNVWLLAGIIAIGFTVISAGYALLALPIQRALQRGANRLIVNRVVAAIFVVIAVVFVTR